MSSSILYVAMKGAEQISLAQAINSNNLANINTPGFKSDLYNASSQYVEGDALQSEQVPSLKQSYTDFSPGSMMTTGRDLDVAVSGQGWFAVQTPDGGEGYTRAGGFKLNGQGQLTTGSGLLVLGNGGPITVPPADSLHIGKDGNISIKPSGQADSALASIDRLKLVNPDTKELQKGEDGLFHMKSGGQAPADSTVRVTSGALEGSNVNAVEALVSIINLSRSFEMQVKLMHTEETDGELESGLLT